MLSIPDECWLDDILGAQSIGVSVFLPFAIMRLRGETQQGEATIAVLLRDVDGEGEQRRILRLRWHPESVPPQAMVVQERVVTEWAACGVACCLMAIYTDFRLSQVAAGGDRFDYWVSDGQREIGLEASGTMMNNATDLEARHRVKVRQLQDNPYGVDGFVAVVGFSVGQAIISFHQFGEAV